MGARRRVGPAAVAAALIGLSLALYRPRLVPELRPGTRRATPDATIAALPRAPGAAAASAPGSPDAFADAAAPVDPPGSVSEEAELRDAPADQPLRMTHPGQSALRASGTAARLVRELRESPSSAETDPLLAVGASGSARASKGDGASAPRLSRETRGTYAARPRARRAPLAAGLASPDEWLEDDGGEARAVRAGPTESTATSSAWPRRRTRRFPLFRPPRREARAERSGAARKRVRPLLLSKLLGRGALRPPSSAVAPPDLSRLSGRKPPRLPDGSPSPDKPYELFRIEAHDPLKAAPSCRRREAHWDAGPVWHDGAARGVAADGRWLWLWKQDARWWAQGEAKQPPLLRHQQLWWSKQKGVWFALHDGELWSWRLFSDWAAEGLLRLTDGVEIVYSADFTKVAVITPGDGARLYDAETGAELGEWYEHEMPARRPRAPAGLRLPRGI